MKRFIKIRVLTYESTSPKVQKKIFFIFFKNKMAAWQLSQNNSFFSCRTSTDRNFAPRAKNQSFSENMAENLVLQNFYINQILLRLDSSRRYIGLKNDKFNVK